MLQTMHCVRCVAGQKPCNIDFSAVHIRPLWTLVEQWISAAVAEPVTITTEAAIFLQYQDFKDSFHLRRRPASDFERGTKIVCLATT